VSTNKLRDGTYGTDPTDPFKAAVCPECTSYVTPGSHYCQKCGATHGLIDAERQVAAETGLQWLRWSFAGAATIDAFFALIALVLEPIAGLVLGLFALLVFVAFALSFARSRLRSTAALLGALLHTVSLFGTFFITVLSLKIAIIFAFAVAVVTTVALYRSVSALRTMERLREVDRRPT
jgi:hypothetical protein